MAKARVNAPSLPINIDNIIINFPFVVNSCVSPRDSPTVLNAETDSKIMSIMGAFSVMLNRKAEITTTITENADNQSTVKNQKWNPAFKNNYTVLAGNNCPDTCPEYPQGGGFDSSSG